MSLFGLIMAGGGGTRFWPRSRQRLPKQFLQLVGERTLLQQAFDRIETLTSTDKIWVITSAAHENLVAEQLPQMPRDQIVGEPCGRDTAACVGLGAALAAARDPEAVVVVTPADHIIEPSREFHRAISAAVQLVAEYPRALITLGVMPTHPATGYGYIHRGQPLGDRHGVAAYKVRACREKPAAATAETYVRSGEYFWNSGIFVWRAQAVLDELRRQQPDIYGAVSRIASSPAAKRAEVFRQEYEPLNRISIDYAVLENAQEVLVLQAPFRWDDVGSWQAIERTNPQDAAGNTVLADHAGLETKDCIIVGEKNRLIATAGIENLIIVQDGDATLIADKRDEAAIKKLVEQLKQSGREKYL